MPHHPLTQREIEVKLRVNDIAALIRRLRKLGARSRGRVLERNTLYDTHMADIRRRGCLLRLRMESPAPSRFARAGPSGAVLTYKAPAPESLPIRYKVKLETELAVRHPRRWPGLLRNLGFRPGFRYEKYRTTFGLPGIHLDLDETPIGTYLELEGSPGEIDRAARALGFSLRDYIRATYWDLYAADCRRRGRAPRNLLFPI